MWHMRPDTWHIICDTWDVTHGGGWTFSQNFSSLDLTVCDRQCLGLSKQKDHRLNLWINDKGVCRTDPTTLGLVIMSD